MSPHTLGGEGTAHADSKHMKGLNNMTYTSKRDDKVAYEDGALYVIYFKETFGNGRYRNRLVLRHAFTIDQAEHDFEEECKAKGIDYRLYRIFQAYESRRYEYHDFEEF